MATHQNVYLQLREIMVRARHHPLKPSSHLIFARETPGIILSLGVVAAIGQHIFTSIAQDKLLFLFIGVILTPIGAFNGLGIWLGLW